ncbi:ThiF family adenylyltransferase [Cellulomonas persica]|uniref:ThiF family adenylyltransferase n=1 Tax=Cellulomonas persica TaxID=76861 RepID=UPI0016498BAC|nr:ThiF family adenylyltransferase [Cellulomonas persica]
MRLRSGLRVVRRGLGEVQIGTDRRWAVRVDGLTPPEARVLEALADGTPVDLAAGDARLDRSRLTALVGQLEAAGVTEPVARRATTGPSGADARVLTLLRPDGDGGGTVAARAERAVGVVGLGTTGLGIAAALATAGVGRVVLEDERPVRSADVGPSGYRWPDVGRPRARAAVRVVTGIAPTVATEPAPTTVRSSDDHGAAARVDLVVVVSDDVVDPALAARLVNRGTPHLSVVLREADTVVGPLVAPGRGPCLRCLDLHRRDADPAWPALAAALATTAASHPPPEPVAVASAAAGLASAAVLAHLDAPDAPHRWHGATFELGLPDALPRERRWAVHPACGCTAQGSGDPAVMVRPRGACVDGLDHAWSGRPLHR